MGRSGSVLNAYVGMSSSLLVRQACARLCRFAQDGASTLDSTPFNWGLKSCCHMCIPAMLARGHARVTSILMPIGMHGPDFASAAPNPHQLPVPVTFSQLFCTPLGCQFALTLACAGAYDARAPLLADKPPRIWTGRYRPAQWGSAGPGSGNVCY